ncbi:hypothetical protein [Cellulomonas sp. PhB150]|uniref:hypothetical protein n=1 Tax=Cellulomonas sp. PhB150 TaxID=2485188 RepID=UPI000F48B640|nr:hypothetical protein [Cellulomonas sp. PhB150]ROS23118.1 hypothetical protein EDF34_3294 [Cellulomonas sp. PhB150]
MKRNAGALLTGAVVGALTIGGLAAPAQAATGGGWTTLSTGGGLSIITEPATIRLPAAQGKRLLVGWATDGASKPSVLTRQVTTSGKLSGPVRTVVKGWASLDERVAFTRSNGKVVVALQGIRTTNVGEKYDGAVAYATSGDGAAWSLAPGGLSRSASGGYALDVIDDRGTLVSAFTAASDDRLRFHVGADAVIPSTKPDGATAGHSGNAYYGTLARDARTGEVWAAWYQLGSSTASTGLWTQRILPTPSTAVKAPGTASILVPDQSLALVPRSGGGIYLAYAIGYPSTTAVRLWKVGSKTSASTYTQVKAANARDISASPAPGGRLWVSWATSYSGARATAKAVRTSTNAKRFGAVVATKAVHSGTIWKTSIEGSRGPADIVVTANVTDTANTVGLYQTQVKPGLSAALSKSSVRKAKGGKVTVTVADAGLRLKGARVVYGGKAHTTNAKGQASFTVAKGTSTGKKGVSVAKSGYTGKRLVLKVVR